MRRVAVFAGALALVSCGEVTEIGGGDEAPVGSDVPGIADVPGDLGGASDATDAAPDGDGGGGILPATSCAGLEDGAPCEDGNPCTVEEACLDGACEGGSSNPCDGEGPCRPGNCDAKVGCVFHDEEDGTPCQVACFGEGTCEAGECEAVPGTETPCPTPEDDRPCVLELRCDPATGGCTKEIYRPAGTECDTDGDRCALETCDGSGECLSTGEVDVCAPEAAGEPCWTWACEPETGACLPGVFVAGASCQDGNPCTWKDSCRDHPLDAKVKVCLGDPIPADDGDPCTDDACVDGVVVHTAVDGVPCDDENPCTKGDACGGGTCQGALFACDDANPCTKDFCNGDGSCTAIATEGPCDDADPCTVEACQGGACAANAIDCSDGDPCTSDGCSGGECSHQAKGCDDADPCTADACAGGACTHLALDCSDGDPCTVDACAGGACGHAALDCADADPCTVDSCDGGECVHAPLECADADPCTTDSCAGGDCAHEALDCSDGDPCTTDACAEGSCAHEALDCSDGDPCTADSCAGGACVHDALDCGDADPCTADSCSGGECSHAPLECADADPCTLDSCAGGECVHAPLDCADSDPCTIDTCSGGACLHGPLDCTDGDACTSDTCAGGSCSHGPLDCADEDPCTVDGCDGEGCVHLGFSCEDGEPCTVDECDGAACLHTAAEAAGLCDDGDGCTIDACEIGAGCVHTALSCDDGDLCTLDSCGAGGCAHPATPCDDGDPCTDDLCDSSIGCVQVAVPCDDGEPCTLDTCEGTGCGHEAVGCDDGDPCTEDSCGDDGCVHPALDCDDGDACTEDSCGEDGCVHPALDCDDADACTSDACGESGCSNDALDCEDGVPCTEDSCEGGGCLHAENCDDGDACTTDACDEADGGGCTHVAVCDDADPCTVDFCNGAGDDAVCSHEAVDCADEDDCTVDGCEDGACSHEAYDCDDGDECTARTCNGDGTCTTVPLVAPVTRIWVGGSGEWHTPSSWDPPGVPCGADYAAVNQEGAVVTTASSITFLTLHVGGTVPSTLVLSQPTVNESATLTVADHGELVLAGAAPSTAGWTVGALHVEPLGRIGHASGNATGIALEVLGDADVAGLLDATGLGQEGKGKTGMAGGSHGGPGGGSWSGGPAPKTAVHGLLLAPADLGSPGNAAWGDNPGGGRILLDVHGALVLTGSLLADGADAPSVHMAGGSGGSIRLTAGSISGSGTLSAAGGNAEMFGGGGGGGRVAIDAGSMSFSGAVSVAAGTAGSYGSAGKDGTYALQMTAAAKFVLTTPPFTASVLGTAGPFHVELQDEAGAPVTVQGGPLAVELGSSSPTGTFSATAGFSESVDRVVIPPGATGADFWARDTKSGTHAITAGGPVAGGVEPAVQVLVMDPGPATHLDFLTEPPTVPAGAPSPPLTLERRDVHGNPAPAGNLVVSLATTSGAGRFAPTAAGPFDGSTTTATFPAGVVTATFHYEDAAAGVATVTASDPGGAVASVSQEVLVVTGPDLHIWIGPSGDWSTASSWDPPSVPSPGSTAVVNRPGVVVSAPAPAFASLQVGGTVPCQLDLGAATSGDLVVADHGKVVSTGAGALELGSLEVREGGVLTHTSGNPNGVHVVATGDVAIDGTVDARGLGQDGKGKTGMAGGSHGGRGGGSWSGGPAPPSAVHGLLLEPADLGSPGNAAWGDNPGGGRVDLEAGGTLSIDGEVRADGATAPSVHMAGGSGGSVRLSAPVVTGSGLVSARGGNAEMFGGGGSGGRVAIDAGGGGVLSFAGTVDVEGGTAGSYGSAGEPGTWAHGMGDAVRFAFTSGPSTVTVGEVSAPLHVELQDASGAPVAVGGRALSVELTTTSPKGQFSADAGFATTVDRVSIPVGATGADLWYRDGTTGTATLTAGGPIAGGIEVATCAIAVSSEVTDHLVLVTEPWTFPVGASSPGITVERRDAFDNPVFAGTLTLALASTSGAGSFDAGATVQIAPGASTATFRYTDGVAGKPTVTVSDPGGVLAPVSQVELVVEGPDLHIWVGPSGAWEDPASWDPPTVPTDTSTVYVNRLGVAAKAGSPVVFGSLQVGGTVATKLELLQGAGGALVVAAGGTLAQAGGALDVSSLEVEATGLLTQIAGAGVDVLVSGDAAVGGTVDVTGLGSDGAGKTGMAGGSHGGRGGGSWSGGPAPMSAVHGSLLEPVDLGSPGNAAWGDNGGSGRIRLDVGGTLSIDGVLRADGSKAPSVHMAGASGGSVRLAAAAFTGGGLVSATGGSAEMFGGGGSGGRVAIEAPSWSFSGTVLVEGGQAGSYGSAGEAGTYARNMGAADRFEILSAPLTQVVVDTSAAIRVELRDAQGAPVVVQGLPLAVELSSTSAGASFSATAGFSATVDRVFVPVGQTGVDFFYRDTKAGTATVTAGGPIAGGVTPATLDFTMLEGPTAKLVLVTETVNAVVGKPSQTLTVERRDVYDNPTHAGDLEVALSTTSPTGRFDLSPLGAFDGQVATVVIPAGLAAADFFYLDTTLGTPSVSVLDLAASLQGDSVEVNVVEDVGD